MFIDTSSGGQRWKFAVLFFAIFGSCVFLFFYLYTRGYGSTNSDFLFSSSESTFSSANNSSPCNCSIIKCLVNDVTLDPDTDVRIDNLNMTAIEILPEYRSPCWYESLPSPNPYHHQTYLAAITTPMVRARLREQFRNNSRVYGDRYTSGECCRWRLRCLPAFYVLGVRKSGTAYLWNNIVSHPDVAETRKEKQYWNVIRYAGNRRSGVQFNQHFRPPIPLRTYVDLYDVETIAKPARSILLGDGSASTLTMFPAWSNLTANRGLSEPKYTAAHLIRSVTPNVKLLVILRDPVQRLLSEYLWFRREHGNMTEFQELVRVGVSEMKSCLQTRSVHHCVYNQTVVNAGSPVTIANSMYHPFLEDWIGVFGRDQLLVLNSEDYFSRTEQLNRKIFTFLGLDPDKYRHRPVSKNANRFTRRNMSVIPRVTRRMLERFFSPFNWKLSALLDDRIFVKMWAQGMY